MDFQSIVFEFNIGACFALAKYAEAGNFEWVYTGIMGLVILRSFLPN